MSHIDVPVLIVGGGGAGLTTSILLSSYGIDHLLVERHDGTSILPKAHYLNPRTMEILRQYGAADVVYANGTPLENMSKVEWRTTLAGDGPFDAKKLYEMDCFGVGDTAGEYRRNSTSVSTNLPQIRLEPVLREEAEARSADQVKFGYELVDLTQDDQGVTASVRELSTGENHTVRAEYLVAADGGKTIGQMLGVNMVGPTKIFEMLSVHIAADLSRWWDDNILIAHFIPSGGRLIPMGPTWGRHSEEWVAHFAIPPHESAPDESEIVARIVELVGADLDIQIHKISPWWAEGVVADRYQVGRVFLVGDSAHRHPPTTGLGLNTGVQDVHNLVWKLAAVLRGHASPELLDSYQTERQPIGVRNVEWAMFALQNHTAIDAGFGLIPFPVSPEMDQLILSGFFADGVIGEARRARFRTVVETQRIEFCAQELEMGFAYPAGAVIPDDSPLPERDPLGVLYTPTSRPGHRLPHAWLEHEGRRLSAHDLVGAESTFALITGTDGSAWVFAAEQIAEKFGITITTAAIGETYRDVDGEWKQVRGIDEAGAILVRPDNHVAWRAMSGSDQPVEALAHAVATVLAR